MADPAPGTDGRRARARAGVAMMALLAVVVGTAWRAAGPEEGQDVAVGEVAATTASSSAGTSSSGPGSSATDPVDEDPVVEEADWWSDTVQRMLAAQEATILMPPSTLPPTTPAPSTTAAPPTTRQAASSPVRRPGPAGPPTVRGRRAPPSGPGVPPIPHYDMSEQEAAFFECVRFRESTNNPGAVNRGSGAQGLYQFMPTTWDWVARHIGRYDLVGVAAALSPPELQTWMAHELFIWQGARPWVADGCVLPNLPTTPTTLPPVPTWPTWPPPETVPDSTTTSATPTTTVPPATTVAPPTTTSP